MDIDMSALRGARAGEGDLLRRARRGDRAALLTAYHSTPRAPAAGARVELDRKTGHVTVLGGRARRGGQRRSREYDDTPDGFGRIAATTAKQVILQRLRDAEDEQTFGEFSGKEGDIVSGVIQQGRNPRDVLVDLGKVEARAARRRSRCRGSATSTAPRIKCYVVAGPQGHARPADHAVAHPPQPGARSCSPSRCPRSPTARSRSPPSPARPATAPRSRSSPTGPGVNAKGACIGPMGAAGPQRDDRAARREDRHRRLVRRPGRVRRPRAVAGPGAARSRSSTSTARSARVIVPDYQLSLAIGKEGQNARLAARLTGWRIDIRSDAADGDARARPRAARPARVAAL